MKLTKMLLMCFLITSLFIACTSENKDNEESSEESSTVKEACTYSFLADLTQLKWTAYKFTERIGVSGTFNSIIVTNTPISKSPVDVLIGAEFVINTATVNSKNLERDPKLVAFFFGKLIGAEIISGKINSINNDEAVVSITMNGKNVDVIGNITADGDKVSMRTSIDMSDFDGLNAIESLNEACSALHTDADGESKLWPDVSIVVSTVLKKECK